MFINRNICMLGLLCSVIFLFTTVCVAEIESTVQFSGIIESEAGIAVIQEDETTTESDFTLATVELGADAQLSDSVGVHLLLLYEEGENDDNIAVDEGSITIKDIYGVPLVITFGRMYVPFGEFNSHFVSDPFTLEIGETNKNALQISIEQQFLATSLALFKSRVVTTNDENNRINNLTARISVTTPEDSLGGSILVSGGVSLIKNFADTDGISDVLGLNFDADELDDIPPGIGVFTSIGLSGVFLESEFITALSDFSGETVAGAKFESKPWALNAEIGYILENLPIPIEAAAKFERLYQGGNTDVNRFGGVISAGIFEESAGIAVEFLRTDTGDESDTENTFTFQLSTEF